MRAMPLRSVAVKVKLPLRVKVAPLMSAAPFELMLLNCGPSVSGAVGVRDKVTTAFCSLLRLAWSVAMTLIVCVPSVLASVFQL